VLGGTAGTDLLPPMAVCARLTPGLKGTLIGSSQKQMLFSRLLKRKKSVAFNFLRHLF
jgi:hypothetical protein